MKRILFSPLFNLPPNLFYGDQLAHYHIGKYVWHVCNVDKVGFSEPIYGAKIDEEVSLTYVFFEQQPQGKYFKKPAWIDAFLVAKDEAEVNQLARGYDYFVNQYRYRGKQPESETNAGYSPDLNELNLYVPPITHKAVYEKNLYIDDLELEDRYAAFLEKITGEISPDGRPIIALHNRGVDPWQRHHLFTLVKYDQLLNTLLKRFPNHQFVLVGELWHDYQHPRIKKLSTYINAERCHQELGEHNACLQYILSAYFCRAAELLYMGISGFSLFLESIRPLNQCPPIPVFWKPVIFDGVCTCMRYHEKEHGWCCPEFQNYRSQVPHDVAYQYEVHHFLYFSRDERHLKPFCFDHPVTVKKILRLTERLAEKWGIAMDVSALEESLWTRLYFRGESRLPLFKSQSMNAKWDIKSAVGRSYFGKKLKKHKVGQLLRKI